MVRFEKFSKDFEMYFLTTFFLMIHIFLLFDFKLFDALYFTKGAQQMDQQWINSG